MGLRSVFSARPARRAAVLVTAGGMFLGPVSPATADPGCTTADLTAVMSEVAAAMSAYLFTHPEVNAFFTGLQGLPKSEVRDQTEAYLTANPQVRSDLEGIRQPSGDFRTRCNLPQRALILADSI